MTDAASTAIVRWREYSFLDNPRCPRQVKNSKLIVYVDDNILEVKELYSIQEGGKVLLLPISLTSSQVLSCSLLAWLSVIAWI
jgi:hypothetical protein